MGATVTVLIPTYNPGHFLQKALKSVFQQSYPHWKILLLDDASTDDSLVKVTSFLKNSRVHLIRNVENLGQARTLNAGLPFVDTPYVVQLDADDWFLPDALEQLVAAAEKATPDVAVWYGNFQTVYEDPHGHPLKVLTQKGPPFKDRYDFLLKNRTLRPRFYRTSALLKIGGWPNGGPFEDRYVEDRRIMLRLMEDYRFQWVDRLLYVYRKHGQNQTADRKNCEVMLEWIIREALGRWGNNYEPVFQRDQAGWRRLVRLNPKCNKNQEVPVPEVTVVIPFYNPGKHLVTAVESVFNQTKKRWHLILVDDASTDVLPPGLKKHLSDPRVKLIRSPKNLGQSKALNLGLEYVTTPFLVELDADDWFSPDALETLLTAAHSAPDDVGVFYANFTYVYENAKGEIRKTTTERGWSYQDKYGFLIHNRTIRPRFYRTSLLRKIGGWPTDDPYQGRYVEDRLVLFRLIGQCRFQWVDAMLYFYRQHRRNKTRDKKRMREMIEWVIRDALHQWGDEYSPVFVQDYSGLPRFEKLVPLKENKSK